MQKQTKNILSDDFIADHTANLIYTTIVGSKNATPDSHNIKKPLKSKNIDLLQKSKTKFDIAYALDKFYPGRNFTLLLDVYSKKDFVELKNKCLAENGVLS